MRVGEGMQSVEQELCDSVRASVALGGNARGEDGKRQV
jgi:hypothetical protein